jgi:hypothetical protein
MLKAQIAHLNAETGQIGQPKPPTNELELFLRTNPNGTLQQFEDATGKQAKDQDVVKAYSDALAEGDMAKATQLAPRVKQFLETTQKPQPDKPDKDKYATLQLPNGQKAPGKEDAQGNLLLADGTPAPKGTITYQQPNYGQLVLPTKTQTMLVNGIPTVMGWNEQTQKYDVPQGQSATGAYGHEEAQAGAVARGGEQLISDIQANKSRLGTLSSWVEKYGLDTPIADPQLAGLQAELSTFAALQPAMHGFRSKSAQEAFQKIIGEVQKNPDATIASIRGILKTAGAINPQLSGAGKTVKVKGTEYPIGPDNTVMVNGTKYKLNPDGKSLGRIKGNGGQ